MTTPHVKKGEGTKRYRPLNLLPMAALMLSHLMAAHLPVKHKSNAFDCFYIPEHLLKW